MDPRKFATLETPPQKWERIQVDQFTWMNPVSKEKFHILVIDEATRFRVAKVAVTGKGNTTTWAMIKQILEDQWFQYFGHPKMVRADSAGPWASDEAAAYFEERGMELAHIPGEAHWQMSDVEGAIKSMRGIIDALHQEFPDHEIHELTSRAAWVCSNEEQRKGFSPLQQVLGRPPDEYGRMFENEDEAHPSQHLR